MFSCVPSIFHTATHAQGILTATFSSALAFCSHQQQIIEIGKKKKQNPAGCACSHLQRNV